MMHTRLETAENSIREHDHAASRKTLISRDRDSKQVSIADPINSERNGYTIQSS